MRFDVLGRDAGQIVIRAYGTMGRAEAGSDSQWMRVNDQSQMPADRVTYYFRSFNGAAQA